MPARSRKPKGPKSPRRARLGAPPPWAKAKTEDLLQIPLCDLGLRIQGSGLEAKIQKLHEELRSRNLRIKPYFWLSDDWFTPNGYTGTAIPFYLAHPRLTRLERAEIGEVEGGTAKWCMQLLRHEAGHVLDHAFRLNRRRHRQQIFGRSSHRYPRFYRPDPYSKRHVQHLEYWYAQSHPDEDFAETFAVWLQPRSGWRRRYAGWPALEKLEYVDELMGEIAGKKPPVKTRSTVDELGSLKKTLGEHYRRKQRGVGEEYPETYDADLCRLFSARKTSGSRTAASLLRKTRAELVRSVAQWTGENPYLLNHVIKDMAGRARELNLHTQASAEQLKVDLASLVTKHVMNSVYREGRWVEM